MTERLRLLTSRAEDGWVAITAIVLMAIMLSVGLASLAFIDGGTKRSQEQRVRESSLSLAEGTLYAQGFALARTWPSATSAGFPASCTSTLTYAAGSVLAAQCPDKATLTGGSAATFTSVDFADATKVQWTTRIRDDGGALTDAWDPVNVNTAQAFNGVTCPAPAGYAGPGTPCTRDWNGNGELWVDSRAVVRGKAREVVARLKLETLFENVPRVAVTSGALAITNEGNNLKINATDSEVILRCNVGTSSCANWRQPVQIKPTAPVQGNPPPLMKPAQIQRMRDTAKASGTYYDDCEGTSTATRKVLTEITSAPLIFLENCTNPPNYGGAGYNACSPPSGLDPSCVNNEAKPGLLIVHCGALRMTGSWTYAGVIYFANGSDNDPEHPCTPRGTTPPTCSGNSLDANTVLDTQGGFGVWGAINVDGNACLKLGSNGFQIQYDADMFNGIKSLGTVGLVQNSWRELAAG